MAKKKTQEEAEKIFLERGFVLIDEYRKEAVKCTCVCVVAGHITRKSLSDVRVKNCKVCQDTEARFSQEEAKGIFLEHGFILQDFYINNNTKHLCICVVCGSQNPKTLKNVKKKRGCKTCYELSRFYKDEVCRKLSKALRCRLKEAMRGFIKLREISSVKDLGCTLEFFKNYIEALWLPGMNWDNWGLTGWHLDHIKPLVSFDLRDPEQQRLAVHFKNMQPLWAFDNQSKGGKY